MSARRSALCLVLLLLAASCRTTRTYRLGNLEPWPPAGAVASAPIVLRIYGNQRFQGSADELDLELLSVWREQALRAYRESSLFTQVEAGWAGGGLLAEVGFEVRTGALKNERILRGDFFYEPRNYLMRTRFRDAQGRSLGLVEVSEAVRLYDPFSGSVEGMRLETVTNRTIREVIYDLHRATLRRALEEHILPAQ